MFWSANITIPTKNIDYRPILIIETNPLVYSELYQMVIMSSNDSWKTYCVCLFFSSFSSSFLRSFSLQNSWKR